ncbi:MAG: GHKL domain-containing protein [Lachnospiraceae bacterium]|nr:GHKL domain-containing protein [Lachnospiraceae bacterium]
MTGEYLALDILLSVISNITFVLSMLLIILIAVCFLGRYAVISRKMVIGALGLLVFEAIAIIFIKINEVSIDKWLYDLFLMEEIPVEEDFGEYVRIIGAALKSFAVNSVAFVYAFVFYMFSYREKRFLRSLGSVIGLYGYYVYMQSAVMYAVAYLAGGDADIVMRITYGKDDQIPLMIIYQTICLIITAAVVCILYFAYYRKRITYVLSIKTRVFFVLWLIIFSLFPNFPIAAEGGVQEQYRILCIIMGIMLPIIGTLAPVLLIMNASDKSLKERFLFQENYLNAELEYIEQYKNKQTETRAFRHDIINNLSLMDMMMKDGKNEDAKQHLEGLLENVSALSPEFVTGDEMLDCIVAMKAGRMKEKDIDFTLDGIADGGLHMKPMDICRVFANALDNAIEAVEGLKEGTKKQISMQIKRTEQFFVVRISNTTSGKVNVEKLVSGAGYSSKKDYEHHGFGIRSIVQAVESYDGMTKFESTDGEFTISVMIPRQN